MFLLRRAWSAVAFLPLIASLNAHALPQLPDWGPMARTDVAPLRGIAPRSMPFQAPPQGQVDFNGIVALNNCSGSLVRFQTSLGTDHAMVLTNGHCLEGADFLKPGEVRINTPSRRNFRLLRQDGAGALATLTAERVLYATMTQTDMTLYSLRETYDQIQQAYGITALTFSPRHPAAGEPIAIASGYWRRIYTCRIDRFIYQLKEADWTFFDSVRYSTPGCEIAHGTSGSPIIDAATHEVVGVNNTGNDDGGRCTMNNPCEVDEHGNVVVVPHASYGQETFWLYSCLGQGNQLDFNKPGCQMPHLRPYFRM